MLLLLLLGGSTPMASSGQSRASTGNTGDTVSGSGRCPNGDRFCVSTTLVEMVQVPEHVPACSAGHTHPECNNNHGGSLCSRTLRFIVGLFSRLACFLSKHLFIRTFCGPHFVWLAYTLQIRKTPKNHEIYSIYRGKSKIKK